MSRKNNININKVIRVVCSLILLSLILKDMGVLFCLLVAIVCIYLPIFALSSD